MAFNPNNPNLRLWFDLEATDPAYTKPITGKAFKGTALNGEYVMKRLTEAFGPVGLGWGYVPTFEDVHFPSGKSLNFCTLAFWYYPNGCKGIVCSEDFPLKTIGARAEFTQVGGTELAGNRKSGDSYADDEARKKSITDALLKAASHIGIGADIHLGMFDDSKYVTERTTEEANDRAALDRAKVADAAKEAFELGSRMAEAQDAAALHELLDDARTMAAELSKIGATEARKALVAAVQANMKRLNIAPPVKQAA